MGELAVRSCTHCSPVKVLRNVTGNSRPDMTTFCSHVIHSFQLFAGWRNVHGAGSDSSKSKRQVQVFFGRHEFADFGQVRDQIVLAEDVLLASQERGTDSMYV